MKQAEYLKNVVRMWDSIRSDYKGKANCSGVSCSNCPLYGKVCGADMNTVAHAYKAIEIVDEWVKEHPVQTNADKFRELFGVEPPIAACVNNIGCEHCKFYKNGGCNARNLFWNAECEL